MMMGSNIMTAMNSKTFASAPEWRQWLEKNHDREKELWLVFFKKHTGRQTFTYGEALDEALCFGWIDGILQRVDDATYRQRFTPRGQKTSWSEVNLKRARRLIDAGRMTASGLSKLVTALERYEKEGVAHRPPRAQEASPELMALIRKNRAAWSGLEKLAPSYRRQYLGWVMSAKKPETRERRVRELITVLVSGKKLGLK